MWSANDFYSPVVPPRRSSAEAAMNELGKGEDFLVVYYGSYKVDGSQCLDRPPLTLTTLDRFGLVQ
jgi:DNA (cytosine-5)-methyltransferase 1